MATRLKATPRLGGRQGRPELLWDSMLHPSVRKVYKARLMGGGGEGQGRAACPAPDGGWSLPLGDTVGHASLPLPGPGTFGEAMLFPKAGDAPRPPT